MQKTTQMSQKKIAKRDNMATEAKLLQKHTKQQQRDPKERLNDQKNDHSDDTKQPKT